MITNRGVNVYPGGLDETYCTDHWRCRFMLKHDSSDYDSILALMRRLHANGFEIIKTENLYFFDGQPGFSAGQGQ